MEEDYKGFFTDKMNKNISCNTCYWNNSCSMKDYGIQFLKIIKDDGSSEYIQIHIPPCNEYREKEEVKKNETLAL